MNIQPLDREHLDETIELMGLMSVSLFGIQSPRLHRAVARDAVRRLVDCRIALGEEGGVLGVVLAAPSSYWWRAPLTHWSIAYECLRARLRHRVAAPRVPSQTSAGISEDGPAAFATGKPPFTWQRPGRAWRIIFIGTAPRARGRGVASALYRALMADRPFVAHVSPDNIASIRMHTAVGLRMYHDGGVLQFVHAGADAATSPMPEPAHETLRAAVRSDADSGKTRLAPRS